MLKNQIDLELVTNEEAESINNQQRDISIKSEN